MASAQILESTLAVLFLLSRLELTSHLLCRSALLAHCLLFTLPCKQAVTLGILRILTRHLGNV